MYILLYYTTKGVYFIYFYSYSTIIIKNLLLCIIEIGVFCYSNDNKIIY